MSKRVRNPRAKSSSVRPPQQAAGSLAGAGGLAAQAFVIRAARTKHGPRGWGKVEVAQAAIAARYPNGPPVHLNYSKLARDVDADVRRDYPDFVATYGETQEGFVVDAMTLRRALKKLREANR
jgi:hypothetical protein